MRPDNPEHFALTKGVSSLADYPDFTGSFVPFTIPAGASTFGRNEMSMQSIKYCARIHEGHASIEFKAAALLASPGSLGLDTMNALPLSVIAFGWIKRQNLDCTTNCAAGSS
jgi:hypothetical protein